MPLKREAGSAASSPAKKAKVSKPSLSVKQETMSQPPTQNVSSPKLKLQASPTPACSSTHNRVQTEKALQAILEHQERANNTPATSVPPPTLLPSPVLVKKVTNKASRASPIKRVAKRVDLSPSPELGEAITIASDDDEPTSGGFNMLDDHVSETVPSGSERSNGSVSRDNLAIEINDSDPDESGMENIYEDKGTPKKTVAVVDNTEDADDEGDDEPPETDETVMHSGFQDPLEREMGLYESLPFLPKVVSLLPFRWYLFKTGIDLQNFLMAAVKFSNVNRHYTHLTRTSIVQGLLFVQAGPYVNLSRIDPTVLCSVDNRVSFLETKKTAACVFIGFASGSNIVEPLERTTRTQEVSRCHQLTVSPFAQFFRREIAVLGQVLGFSSISGSAVDGSMSFTSRSEQAPSSAPSSPTKTTRLARSRLQSTHLSSSGQVVPSTTAVPTSLKYSEEIPVYDGRPGVRHSGRGFDFSGADFASLTRWPRFPESEVPTDAAVAVGYTANTYKSTGQGTDYVNLSTNILFVVVLGLFDEQDPVNDN